MSLSLPSSSKVARYISLLAGFRAKLSQNVPFAPIHFFPCHDSLGLRVVAQFFLGSAKCHFTGMRVFAYLHDDTRVRFFSRVSERGFSFPLSSAATPQGGVYNTIIQTISLRSYPPSTPSLCFNLHLEQQLNV